MFRVSITSTTKPKSGTGSRSTDPSRGFATSRRREAASARGGKRARTFGSVLRQHPPQPDPAIQRSLRLWSPDAASEGDGPARPSGPGCAQLWTRSGQIAIALISGRPTILESWSKAQTRDFLQQVIERSKEVPVVVDFGAEWNGQRRALGPAIEKAVSDRAGKVEPAKVDVDSNQQLAAAHRRLLAGALN